MAAYFLGIDGGGTSCRAAIADSDGQVLGRAKSGAANILTDPDTALKHILEASLNAFEDAKLPADFNNTHAVLGLAGTNVGAAVDYISARMPFASAELVSDGLIALQGALGDSDGAIGILGTGSLFMLRTKGEIHSIGGWGFRVGDFGSGARLGQELLRETLLAADGIREETPVLNAVLERFNGRVEELANFGAEAKPGDFGTFAPLVFEFAAKGDACALALIKQAATVVDAALDTVQRRLDGGKISMLGGLSPLFNPYLAQRHQAHFVEAENDPVIGAVQLAKQAYQRQIASAS